jgi:hypothetical protein
MPLRDHFDPAIPHELRWESFHSTWPITIVRRLNRHVLSAPYKAAPSIRLGAEGNVDVGAREGRVEDAMEKTASAGSVAVYAPPRPALSFEADLSQEDLFEVQVFDDAGAHLVAAIEFISPRNKDRPQSRHEFVVKCASLLKAEVSLVLIDIVTTRRANLLKELMEYLEIRDLSHPLQGHLYGCSLLPRGSKGHAKVDVWPEALQVGHVLPTMPLWLRDDLAVALDLESTYQETWGDLGA